MILHAGVLQLQDYWTKTALQVNSAFAEAAEIMNSA